MSKKNVELERTAQKISENGQSFAQFSDSVLDAARQQAEAILAEAKVQADQKYASIVGVQRTDPDVYKRQGLVGGVHDPGQCADQFAEACMEQNPL